MEFLVVKLLAFWASFAAAQDTPLGPNAFAKEILRMGRDGQLDRLANLVSGGPLTEQGGSSNQGTGKMRTNGTVRFYLYNNRR